MFEELAISSGVKIISELFKSVFKEAVEDKSKDFLNAGSDTVWRWFRKKNEELDIFKLGAERYTKQMFDRYNRVKILGMVENISLESLYVKAYVLSKIKSRNRSDFKEIEYELETYQNKQAAIYGERNFKRDAFEIVNEKDKFVILGKPGAGKSTFLKYVAIESLKKSKRVREQRIPVFISLKEYADSGKGLIESIVQEFEVCGFENPKPFILRVLEKGKCLLLLDGLDEVSSSNQIGKVIKEIRDLSDEYKSCQFIVSCRSASYYNSFEAFSDVEVADFDLPQIKTFIKNYFNKKPHNIDYFISRIQEDPSYFELASTPLLLGFLCIYFEGNGSVTNNRAELYKEAIEVLLKRWDATRGIKRERKYPEISEKQELNILSEWAYQSFVKNNYFFKRDSIESYLDNYLKEKTGIENGNGYELLKDMESVHSLIIERQRGIYSFAHLTIHEYFVARYIYDNSLSGKLQETVRNYASENKWREVFLILFNMAANETTIDIMVSILKTYVWEIQTNNPTIGQLWEKVSFAAKENKFENIYTLFLCALDKAEATSETKNKQVLIETYKSLFNVLGISYTDTRIFSRSLDVDTARLLTPIYKHINLLDDKIFGDYSLSLLRMIECLKEAEILSPQKRTGQILETLKLFHFYSHE